MTDAGELAKMWEADSDRTEIVPPDFASASSARRHGQKSWPWRHRRPWRAGRGQGRKSSSATPWKIAGPTGTLLVIDTESELKTFVETLEGDPDVNILNFRSMLGILQREAPPRHVIMWQPLSRLQF